MEIENNVITDLTNEEGEVIGIVYDGGQENYEYGKYIFPTLHITIQRDGKEIQLEDKLKLNIYNYNLTTNEEIYLQKVDWDGQNNYFIFNPDGYAKGQTFKFKLLAYDEEGQEKEYELEKSIIKFSRYGELKKLQITLTTSDPEAGGGNDTGILATLKNIFTSITNFFGNFFSLLAQFVKETITMLFVPPDNMMDIITKDISNNNFRVVSKEISETRANNNAVFNNVRYDFIRILLNTIINPYYNPDGSMIIANNENEMFLGQKIAFNTLLHNGIIFEIK